MARGAKAIVLCLMSVVAGLPVGHADAPGASCPEEGCPALDVYLLPGGRPMSPIQGDASGSFVPPLPEQERQGARLSLATAAAPWPYSISSTEPIVLTLASRAPLLSGNYTTRVTLDVVDRRGDTLRGPLGEPAVVVDRTVVHQALPGTTAVDGWSRLSFEPAPPAFLETGSGTWTVPSGARIRLTLETSAAAVSVNGVPVSTWSYGTSRLTLPVATPGLFGALAWDAETIGLGNHTASGAPREVDAFAFEASAGERILVTTSGSAQLQLFAPSGGAPHAIVRPVVAPEAGRYVLRAFSTMQQEYGFHLDVEPPTTADDAGSGRDAGSTLATAVLVEGGLFDGRVGYTDDADTYVFSMDFGQRWRASLVDVAATLDARIEPGPGAAPGGWRNDTATGDAWLRVARVEGYGEYRVLLEFAGTGPGVPEILTIAKGGAIWLRPDGRNAIATASSSGMMNTSSVTPEGTRTPLTDATVQFGFGRDAEGAPVLAGERAVEWWTAAQRTALAPLAPFALMPDGRLAFVAGADVLALAADRSEEVLVPRAFPNGSWPFANWPTRLQYAPDGSLYLTRESPALSATGSTVRVAPTHERTELPFVVQGFDVQGRAYRVAGAHFVERVDLSTGIVERVAYARGEIRGIAVVDGGVFAALTQNGVASIGYVALDVEGYDGPRPSLSFLGAPDVAVDLVEDRILNVEANTSSGTWIVHETRVVVKDQGEGRSRAFDLRLDVDASGAEGLMNVFAGSPFGRWAPDVRVPPMAAGETREYRFTWSGRLDVDYQLWAGGWISPDADPTNDWRMAPAARLVVVT